MQKLDQPEVTQNKEHELLTSETQKVHKEWQEEQNTIDQKHISDAPNSPEEEEQSDEDPMGFMNQINAQRESQQLFNQVYQQRKVENMKALQLYEQTRNKYYLKHAQILESVEKSLNFKVQQATNFFQESIAYYSEILFTYRHFSKALEKIRSFERLKKPESESRRWYASVENGMSRLLGIRDKCVDGSNDFQKWLEGTLISRLKEALGKYNQTIESFQSQIDKARNKSAENDKICFRKLDKIKKIIQDKSKLDLMSEEFELRELYSKFQKSVAEWGHLVSLFWATVQKNEIRLLSSFKQATVQFVTELQRVYQTSHQLDELKAYWQGVELNHQPQFSYTWSNIIKREHTEFIQQSIGKEVNTIEDVEIFFKLENVGRILGSLEEIFLMLSTKRFSVKLDLHKNQKEWVNAQVYLTLDGYLVFELDQAHHLRNKMMMSRLQNQRVSEQVVCVIERLKGVIFDSSNKEWLHFNKIDEVEEFLFMTEADITRKKAYLQ